MTRKSSSLDNVKHLNIFRQIQIHKHTEYEFASSRMCMFVLQDVEANTVRLEEHGKSVLVLERSEGEETGGAANNSK